MSYRKRPGRLPEKNKREGLSYAFSQGGLELPVIDVSHPAFKLSIDAAQEATLLAEAEASLKAQARAPVFLQKALARRMARKSILARNIMMSRGGFMGGMGTYLLKLGPENLGGAYASNLDRRLAAGMAGVNARLRLQRTAGMLAAGLVPGLEAEAGAPLALVNIAGGAAADSLNALMILARDRPDLVTNRKIRIHVLDIEGEGPAFAAAALDALLAERGALEGLDASLSFLRYDWNDAFALGRLLETERGSIAAISSEGGLFEYADDGALARNLDAAAAIPGIAVVGSLSLAGGASMPLNAATSASVGHRLHDGNEFGRFVEAHGWSVAENASIPLGQVFRLVKTNAAHEEEGLNG
jgi:hypothetical protein